MIRLYFPLFHYLYKASCFCCGGSYNLYLGEDVNYMQFVSLGCSFIIHFLDITESPVRTELDPHVPSLYC